MSDDRASSPGNGHGHGTFLGSLHAAIATYLAPLVACDGGTITLVSASSSESTVLVALEGACIGCPARTITRDAVIAPLLARELGRAVTVELA